ncbi:MAG: hypothetical protein E6R04_04745 [Spirochaetes bacterium]|nr:MAG: hypothetical protein E6R04_04745 [Spirochaetota bacterium]
MEKLILALSILFLAACAKSNHDTVEPAEDARIEALEARYESLKSETAAALDPATGWPAPDDCDGLLWAGKAFAAGLPVQIDLAEYSPGELHRRPAPSCWDEKDGDVGSKSTISNDMILGWLWAKWSVKDLDALKRLAKYGEEHNWIMGSPTSMLSRVYLKPNQQGLLGRMIYALSNHEDSRSYRHFFESYPAVSEDYERHLQALGIVLQGDVDMEALEIELVGISDQMLDRLNDLVEAEPQNPLFHAALGLYTGDFDQAFTLLLDDASPVPTYVRGHNVEVLAKVEKLFAMMLVIKAHHAEEAAP